MAKKKPKGYRPDGSKVSSPSASQNPDVKAIRRSYQDRTSTYGGNHYATGDDLIERNRILGAKETMRKKAAANKKLKTPQSGRDIPLPKSNF